jgi:hypothetical protein
LARKTYHPRARTDDLLVEPMEHEVLVCDVRSDSAHVLNETAALVWRACDGQRTASELEAYCRLDASTVELALQSLRECHLLEEDEAPPSVSRRTVLQRAALAGAGLGAAMPLISSVVLPTPAMAATGPTTTPPPTTPGPTTTPPPTTPGPTTTPPPTTPGPTTTPPPTTPAP